MKVQLAVEAFQRVFVWTTVLTSQRAEQETEHEEVPEEVDVTSHRVPVGFHSE